MTSFCSPRNQVTHSPWHRPISDSTDLAARDVSRYSISMNTTSLPSTAAPMAAPLDLFGPPPDDAPVAAGLFADIVFDRPLDHAYTYAVPDDLRDAIGVAKRVEAP